MRDVSDKTKDANDNSAGQVSDLNTLSVGRPVMASSSQDDKVMLSFPAYDNLTAKTPSTRWLAEGSMSQSDRIALTALFKTSRTRA